MYIFTFIIFIFSHKVAFRDSIHIERLSHTLITSKTHFYKSTFVVTIRTHTYMPVYLYVNALVYGLAANIPC